jgi:hypothetical protein
MTKEFRKRNPTQAHLRFEVHIEHGNKWTLYAIDADNGDAIIAVVAEGRARSQKAAVMQAKRAAGR